MALLTTKSFILLNNSHRPPLLSLPKSLPISSSPNLSSSSLQCNANSTTLRTCFTSTHLPKCPIISISNKTSLFSIIASALPPHDDSIEDEWEIGKTPPTLNDDEWGNEPQPREETSQNGEYNNPSENDDIEQKGTVAEARYVDEWGEKAEPDELSGATKLPDADPPLMSDDEWGTGTDQNQTEAVTSSASADSTILADLKQCLVESFYGTEYGLRASSQSRAEIGELISQLEAQNPTPAPTEALSLLQGNWVLVYTSFSELLPLIAAGTLPFVRLGKICQAINTEKFTVENSASYIGPFATFSVRALASFEVQSPKRIEVKFEEGIIPPPEITSTLDIPEKIEIFGQKINLTSFQGSLYPLEEAATRLSQVISGQAPIKIPIRRGGAQSWLLITYLDEDLRISRGDGGGLFVLVKEGSSLLNL